MNEILFLGNLPYTLTEQGIKKIFIESGFNVIFLTIEKDEYNFSKGFGFAVLGSGESSKKVIEKLNGKKIEHLNLRVKSIKEDSKYFYKIFDLLESQAEDLKNV